MPELLREVSENEAWLSQNLPVESSASLEHLKLRVRVELGEQWLGKHLPPANEPVSQVLRERVRAGVSNTNNVVPIPFPSRRRQRVVGAAIGLAAMILLVVVARNMEMGNSPIAEEFDQFEFEEEGEEVDLELSLFDDELAELGEAFALGDESDWDDPFEDDFSVDNDF